MNILREEAMVNFARSRRSPSLGIPSLKRLCQICLVIGGMVPEADHEVRALERRIGVLAGLTRSAGFKMAMSTGAKLILHEEVWREKTGLTAEEALKLIIYFLSPADLDPTTVAAAYEEEECAEYKTLVDIMGSAHMYYNRRLLVRNDSFFDYAVRHRDCKCLRELLLKRAELFVSGDVADK
jgi:hypothetical protein